MPEYIDREAFVAKGRERFCANCDRRKGMKNGKLKFVYEIGDAPCRACLVEDMITEAEDFPAADVRPVVRGEWIFDSDNLPICSECQEIALQRMFVKIPSLIQDVRMVRSNFCPFCGADMRGKEAGTDV